MKKTLERMDLTYDQFAVVRSRILPLITSMNLIDFDLYRFAVECYMQGISDFLSLEKQRPELLSWLHREEKPYVGDYVI